MHIFRFMYVSDASIEPFIMRCGLDAKSCSKIVTVDLVQPLSITFETNPDISKVSRLLTNEYCLVEYWSISALCNFHPFSPSHFQYTREG